MRETITITVAVGDAEQFVRNMSVHGYEAMTTKHDDRVAYNFEFALNDEVTDQYAAFIDYDTRTASISIRPK